MENFIPGLIMGFREGLEAFLIIVIILQYLKKTDYLVFRKNVFLGAGTGIIGSLVVGGVLYLISKSIDKMDEVAKIWESSASILAMLLVTTFIYWMIKHGRNMVVEIQTQVKTKLSSFGIFAIALIMVLREGVEIAVFTFAGKYVLLSILTGIFASLVVAVLVYFSLIKINLKVLFNITLGYLILQAGFLLGYGVHEGLSALKELGVLASDNALFTKLFDLSNTIFYHKEGIVGLPMYVLFGWYSKPEIIQFVLQYLYTFVLFYVWFKETMKKSTH